MNSQLFAAAHRVAVEKNATYEASMNEYSVDSVNRAVAFSAAAEQALVDNHGVDPDKVVVWDGGKWVVDVDALLAEARAAYGAAQRMAAERAAAYEAFKEEFGL